MGKYFSSQLLLDEPASVCGSEADNTSRLLGEAVQVTTHGEEQIELFFFFLARSHVCVFFFSPVGITPMLHTHCFAKLMGLLECIH